MIGAIAMLILGAFLDSPAADIYRSYFPSQESVALSNLDEKVEDIDKSSVERDRLASQKLDEVLARQGNEKARDEYLAAQKELIRMYAEKTAHQPDDELLKKQRENRQRIKQVSQEVAGKCELRWEPAYYYILHLLDSEIERLNAEGYVANIEKREAPLVVVEEVERRETIRQIHFLDGSQIIVVHESGRIESGRLNKQLTIRIFFLRPNYPTDRLLRFRFLLDDTTYESPTTELGIPDFTTKEVPMGDQGFIEAVPIAIRKALNYVIVKSDMEIK